MVDQEGPASPSNGKFWRQLSAGDPVGRPFAEWAYYSPRTPRGLGETELREAPAEVQRETVLIWFWSNYRPVSVGGEPSFGFAEAQEKIVGFASPLGIPQMGVLGRSGSIGGAPIGAIPIGGAGGTFSATSVSPLSVLHLEFGGMLSVEAIQSAAHQLAGIWTRSSSVASIPPVGVGAVEAAALNQAILSRVEFLEATVRNLGPVHGAVGHNVSPHDWPFTAGERESVEAQIHSLKDAVDGLISHNEKSRNLENLNADLKSNKIGEWLAKQADTSFTEINKSISKDAYKLALAATFWVYAKDLISLIEAALKIYLS